MSAKYIDSQMPLKWHYYQKSGFGRSGVKRKKENCILPQTTWLWVSVQGKRPNYSMILFPSLFLFSLTYLQETQTFAWNALLVGWESRAACSGVQRQFIWDCAVDSFWYEGTWACCRDQGSRFILTSGVAGTIDGRYSVLELDVLELITEMIT